MVESLIRFSLVPELPDIVVYLEALEKRILGQRLDRVRIASPFLLRTSTPPVQDAEGKTVVRLRRLGKRICIGLDNDIWLVLHLMIAGRLHWKKRDAKLSPPRGLAAFDFANGTLLWTEAGSQKRASLHVVAREEGLSALDPGGIEVLESDLERFAAVLTSANHTLKRALTDPRLFSGIGNAYSDEILFEARLSPLALTQRLKPEQIERLFAAVRNNLGRWTDRLRQLSGDEFPEKRSSASVTRPTKPTTVRTARPGVSCLPIALCRDCCARTGLELRRSLNCLLESDGEFSVLSSQSVLCGVILTRIASRCNSKLDAGAGAGNPMRDTFVDCDCEKEQLQRQGRRTGVSALHEHSLLLEPQLFSERLPLAIH